jgi:hypothetical protein
MSNKPVISIIGNRGVYTSDFQASGKILSPDATFEAGENLGSSGNQSMLAALSANAPYAFLFLRSAVTQPQFPISQSDYAISKLGGSGSFVYCPLGPTGAGWTQKGQPMKQPFNPSVRDYIIYGGVPYLVALDYDSANNNGCVLLLVSAWPPDANALVDFIGVPNQTSGGYTYQALARDILVDGDRVFALVNFINILPTAPFNSRYMKSEVREYALTGGGANIALSQVGQAIPVGKNAVCLVPFSFGGDKYLFIPCLGGAERRGPSNNGAESGLSLLNVTSGLGAEAKPYIGGAASDLRDFRGVAISSNGAAYILAGDYGTDSRMRWSLYQDTAANLIGKASSTIPINLRVKFGVNASVNFWALGPRDDGAEAEYLAFDKGLVNPRLAIFSYDKLHPLKIGEAWSDANDSYNVIIAPNSVPYE